jgi:glycosyltransferase involved in cell wall biosynthesis
MGLWALSHGLDVFSAFHCGSEYVRALLAPNSVVGRRVIKLRMPMLNHPQMHRRLADDIPRIAYVGRFVSHKGPLVFAQAVRGLGANVVLYGDGPLRPKTAAILATDPTVTFRGWVSHDVMDAELGPGVIVVVPYQAHETFCYVVLEAMARGCCVVASARGAIPELIQDGVNGVLVQDPTATEFRKALADLLRDPARVFSMGERAVTIAGEVPSLGQHTGEMLALYDTLIRRRPI